MTLRKVVFSSDPDGAEQTLDVVTRPGEVIKCISWGLVSYQDADDPYWAIIENGIMIWKKQEIHTTVVGSLYEEFGGAENVEIPLTFEKITLVKKAIVNADAMFLVVTIQGAQEWNSQHRDIKGF